MALTEAQENEKQVEKKMVIFKEERNAISDVVGFLEITDNDTFKMAEDTRVDLENLMCQADAFFDPMIKLWHEGHKLTLGRKKTVYTPMEELKRMLVVKIDKWINIQKQKEIDAAAAEAEKNRKAIEEMNKASQQVDEKGNVLTAQEFHNKVQEVFALQSPDRDPAFHPSKTEIVKDVEVEILKPLAFMRYLVSDEAADIDGADLLEWKTGALKKMIMDQPGRNWPSGPDGCLRITNLYRSKLAKGLKQ
jgi:hypothetical protein